MSRRWEPEAVQDFALLAQCREILERVAPPTHADRADLPATKLGIWPRLFLRDDGALKYAFLLPVRGRTTELHVYPGDTLSQAKILFSDSTRPDALLRLLTDGWHARPNFHFGVREAGFAWQNATASVERYIDWCLAYAPRAGTLERHEWDRLLDELQSRGFASPGDEEKFYSSFKSRKTAVPRPGLHLWKPMASPLSNADALVGEVRSELGHVLDALREPLR